MIRQRPVKYMLMLLSRLKRLPGINRHSALFLLHSAIYHIGLFGISDVLLNFYFVSLGYNEELIGVFQSLPRVGSFLLGIPAGLLAERIGARRVAMMGMAGVGLSYALMLAAGNSPVIIGVCMLVRGISYGAAYIAANPLIMVLTERRYHTHLFSHFNVVTMTATSFGSFIGGYIPVLVVRLTGAAGPNALTSTPVYAVGLAVSCVLMFASIIPLTLMADPSRDHLMVKAKAADDTPTPGESGHDQRIPWLRLTFLSSPFFIFGLTAGWTFPFYNLFFRTTFKIPDQVVGTVLSIGWLGMALVSIVNPWLERRWGRAGSLGLTLTLAGLAFLVLSVASDLAIGVVAFVIAVSARNTMTPLFSPLLMDSLPVPQHNIVSSLSSVVWSLGWFLATGSSGFVHERLGYGFMFQMVALGVFLTGVMIVLIFRSRRPLHERLSM